MFWGEAQKSVFAAIRYYFSVSTHRLRVLLIGWFLFSLLTGAYVYDTALSSDVDVKAGSGDLLILLFGGTGFPDFTPGKVRLPYLWLLTLGFLLLIAAAFLHDRFENSDYQVILRLSRMRRFSSVLISLYGLITSLYAVLLAISLFVAKFIGNSSAQFPLFMVLNEELSSVGLLDYPTALIIMRIYLVLLALTSLLYLISLFLGEFAAWIVILIYLSMSVLLNSPLGFPSYSMVSRMFFSTDEDLLLVQWLTPVCVLFACLIASLIVARNSTTRL